MRKYRRISAKSNFHPTLISFAKCTLNYWPYRCGLWLNNGRVIPINSRFFSDPLACTNSRNVIGIVFLHQTNYFLIHIGTVFNRVNASSNSALHAFCTMSMNRHYKVIIFGGLHDGIQLLLSKLRV